MPPTRLLLAVLFACLLAVAPAPAAAQGPSTSQAPLDVRPAQGPAGSSAVLVATGFAAEEPIRIIRDGGVLPDGAEALEDGTAAVRVAMPDDVGVHKVALQGATSGRVAIGAYTTTNGGAPRPTVVASPKPLAPSGDPSKPWRALVHAVNFSADVALTLRCPCQDNGYATYDFARTDAAGDATEEFDFEIGSYGVIDLGMSEGPGLGGTILAADTVAKPGGGFTPAYRLRPVPAVGGLTGRMFLVGSGFRAGASLRADEDGDAIAGVTADGQGGVVVADDDGPSDDENPTTSVRVYEGDAFGAIGWARSSAAVPPSAGVTRELVAAGSTTRVVGVGLPANDSLAVLGLDAEGRQSVLATTATSPAGDVGPLSVTIPRTAAAGPYRIELAGGSARAYATLSINGVVDPVQATVPRPVEPAPGQGTATDAGGSGPQARRIGMSLRTAKRMRLSSLVQRGVPVRVELRGAFCRPRCAVAAQLVAGAATAKRLGVAVPSGKSEVAVGQATRSLAKGLRLRIDPKLVLRARRPASRLRGLDLALVVTAVDGAGRRGRAQRAITFAPERSRR